MNLVVDQGNTFTKAGIFENDELVEMFHITGALNEAVNRAAPDNCIISSVRGYRFDPKKFKAGIRVFMFSPSTPVPVTNLYESQSTLGMDRLAGVIGSLRYQPSGDNLVIDCGTCITYNFINAKREYIGGGISPGLDIRLKSLHTFTANLPLIKIEEPVELIGKTTQTCIQSGIVNGIIAEIEGIIDRYRKNFFNLSVFLCGGGAKYFDGKIRGAIFVRPELVLYGLNEIVKHNVEIK